MAISRLQRGIVICVLLTARAVSAQQCPEYTPGAIKVEGVAGQTNYVSTAVIEYVGDKANSLDIALAAAKILARENLKRLTALPQDEAGKISGVVDVVHCSTDSKVYATVKYTSTTGKAASSLRKAMENSLRENPTPQSK